MEAESLAHRNISPVLAQVDNKIHAWAVWARKHRENVGWPTTSPAWRMMEQNRIGVRIEPQHIPIHIPEDIARIDAVISRLPPKLQRVIHAQYFITGPVEAKARAAKVGLARFRQLLESTRWAVHVALEVNF
jgi:hypothetical protein